MNGSYLLTKLGHITGKIVLAVVLIAATFPLTNIEHVRCAGAEEVAQAETAVQQSAVAYNSAVARQEELADEISALDEKISKLEKLLPKQQAESDRSYTALYKYSFDTTSMLGMLLDSESLSDMLALLDSYNWVINYNIEQIKKTTKAKEELEDSKASLENDKAEADEEAINAENALAAAKQARAEAQAAALAAQKAEQEAAEAEIDSDTTKSSEQKAQAKEEVQEQTQNVSAQNSDWSEDKSAYVEKWASRIDAYLSGSPLAGTGKIFAEASWDNGVDARLAPAISYVESSKGAACFASYNAWGYGSSGFSSWSEGINTVVAALGSDLYGGYLTKQMAQTYCPPSWSDWYSKVSAQMAQI